MVSPPTEGGIEPRVVSDADRLRAEVGRFEAESRKLKLEADQIENDMTLPFFKRSGFVKAAAAGVVALPLIWFYLDKVVIPYQDAKSELLSIQIVKAKDELNELHNKYETRGKELEASRQRLTQMETRLKGTLHNLKTAQEQERSGLENLKREDQEVKRVATITRMQNDLTRRNRELDAALSSLARIGEELNRPIPVPPVISAATVVLHTRDDDKDEGAYVSVVISAASGEVFTWQEERSERWKHESDKRIVLNRVTALPFALFENATIKICMRREIAHGWRFDYTGSLFIGTEAALRFGRKGNEITHSAGLSCVESPLL